MKIGVLSDTHISGNCSEIPAAVVDVFKGVDMIVHAGDLVDLSVLRKLQGLCPDVKAVAGNMDHEEVRGLLSEKMVFEASGFFIGLIHGYGPPDQLLKRLAEVFKKDKVDVIIFGHSHQPMNEKIGDTLYFNPGSPTDTVFAPYRSFGIIEINGKIKASIVKIKGTVPR
ncbi:MAG: metallophosphatase family protein [Candidatus Omnitrophica bacterium]|jgi:hypothetical protein|nr:metallophosphatase family protein [Candidatus Omnitrophota bacterium]